MKIEEIRALSPAEMAKQLESAYAELLDLRFKAATKQLVNHREIPRLKRDIARMKTIIRERELVLESPAEQG